jgi:hypothetical protein
VNQYTFQLQHAIGRHCLRSAPQLRARVMFAGVMLIMTITGCTSRRQPADPQLVASWMRTSLALVRSERVGAPVASRISAYGALALYEGFAADSRTSLRSLAGQLNGLASLPAAPTAPVDGATVAAAAERIVLDSLFRDGLPAARRKIDSLAGAHISQRRRDGVSQSESDRSVSLGAELGSALLGWAAVDSFFATRGRPWAEIGSRESWTNTSDVSQFVPQTMSGQSDLVQMRNPNLRADDENVTTKGTFANRPKRAGATTLPAFNPTAPTEPYWGHLRPFAVSQRGECDPVPPPPYSERRGSPFWAMGQQFHDTVRALSAEQTQTALFWADNPVATGTPGFHWISIASQMVSSRSLSAEAAVELYALTSVAIADAFIGCWKEKFRSNVVRPVTWVRRAIDATFQTVIPTPPFPEYPSGHSVQSSAAASVLIALIGDSVAFVDSTQVDIGQPPRRFASFSAASKQASISRVYAGVHYFPAIEQGAAQGMCIGRRVLALNTRRRP